MENLMIPQHHFLILFQNNAPKKGTANCAITQKIPSQWKPMCILKQNFIDGISQNNEKNYFSTI
jgi:hypothetical protein